MSEQRRSPLGLEVQTSVENLWNLKTGEIAAGVRVRYRLPGVRRWSTVLLWPDESQTLEDLLELGDLAADQVYARKLADDGTRGAVL